MRWPFSALLQTDELLFITKVPSHRWRFKWDSRTLFPTPFTMQYIRALLFQQLWLEPSILMIPRMHLSLELFWLVLKKIFRISVLKSSNLINIYSPEIAHLKSFIWLTSLLQWWNQTERWKQESAIYKLTCWLVNSNQPLQKKFLNSCYFFPRILQNQSFNWGCVLTK